MHEGVVQGQGRRDGRQVWRMCARKPVHLQVAGPRVHHEDADGWPLGQVAHMQRLQVCGRCCVGPWLLHSHAKGQLHWLLQRRHVVAVLDDLDTPGDAGKPGMGLASGHTPRSWK